MQLLIKMTLFIWQNSIPNNNTVIFCVFSIAVFFRKLKYQFVKTTNLFNSKSCSLDVDQELFSRVASWPIPILFVGERLLNFLFSGHSNRAGPDVSNNPNFWLLEQYCHSRRQKKIPDYFRHVMLRIIL